MKRRSVGRRRETSAILYNWRVSENGTLSLLETCLWKPSGPGEVLHDHFCLKQQTLFGKSIVDNVPGILLSRHSESSSGSSAHYNRTDRSADFPILHRLAWGMGQIHQRHKTGLWRKSNEDAAKAISFVGHSRAPILLYLFVRMAVRRRL